MSKRKTKPNKFPFQTLTKEQLQRAVFARANNELHTIRVSTPILRVIERLVSDEKFRTDVTRRMTSR